jgi:diguanylate cyclase (GGDEF)-like protein/putative nucleotidyltransferase with HDIG domain
MKSTPHPPNFPVGVSPRKAYPLTVNQNLEPSLSLRVLVVDDDPATRALVERDFVRRGWMTQCAASAEEALQRLLIDMFDVVVVDVRMPGMDGLDFVREAKKIWPWQGFVLLSGHIDDAIIFAARDEGITEILEKPDGIKRAADAVTAEAEREAARFAAADAPASLTEIGIHRLNMMRHVTRDALNALAEMRSLAIRDELTGLYNRRHLDEEIARHLQLADRYNHPVAVIMLDIDQFKEVNDQLGHHAGDSLLKEFTNALKAHVRATDVFARYGGDEFVMILPQAHEHEAIGLAQRILDTVRAQEFLAGDHPLRVTTSVGIAIYQPDRHQRANTDLLRQADQALYRAKHSGRNTLVCWHHPPPDPETGEPEQSTDGQALRGRILVVDDEPFICDIIQRILRKAHFAVETASSVQQAQSILLKPGERFDVLLCDLSLPDGNGLEVIRRAREHDRELICMVITGNATTENAINALRQGAYDFITKPVNGSVMNAALDRALAYRALLVENNRYREHLEEMVRVKSAELSLALENITKSYQFSLETMVAMLDSHEYETGQHSLRVRDLTLALARHMGYEGRQLEEIGRGALLHDIGKIGIPDDVLLKPGKLTTQEWQVMRKHPEIGYRFLKNSDFLKTAAGIVLSHHESFDGTGYPNHLKGEEIDIGARIFSVIDSYDAMRSPRVYKESFSQDKALAEIRGKAGTQFDPHVVKAFEAFLPELEKIGNWPR